MTPRTPHSAFRTGFTLIELMVAISIIGMLAAMVLGGMYRASVSAKQLNTKTTVNRVAVQLNEIWESYRTRKLPVDPKLILQSGGTPPYAVQYPNAVAWLTYYSSIRVAAGGTPIYSPPAVPLNPNNNLQAAVIRLAALRELMRLELPCRFSDFLTPANPPNSNPAANSNPVTTLLIPQPMSGGLPAANPGGLSEQYRQFFKAHATTFNTQYESAECLYMIIRFASQNELGQKSITDDPRLVGDADGDGMPEIQDAFAAGSFTSAPNGSPYVQHNMPIAFIRWPAGFLSDLQPGPTLAQYQASSGPTYGYAGARHDIFDPLRIDPRAYVITPLVFSAGPDGIYDVWEHTALPSIQGYPTPFASVAPHNDPYFTDNTPTNPTPIFPIQPNPQNLSPGIQDPLPGAVMDLGTNWPNGSVGSGGYGDNITNHQLNTREQ